MKCILLGMSATDLEIINAALTAIHHDPINDLDDGSPEAQVASANYESLVEAELTKYPWSFASDYDELDVINETPDNEWDYVLQTPNTLIKLVSVEVDGMPIAYKRQAARIYCDYNENVYADYRYRAPESVWPGDFKKGIQTRLEALFLRALDEKDKEGEARDSRADFELLQARNEDAKNKTPRDRRSSRLVSVRRG